MAESRSSIEKYTTSFYVAVLYLVFLTMLFAGFTGYISRVNLGNDLAVDGEGLDTLIFRTAKEEELRDLIEAKKAKHFAFQEEILDYREQITLGENDYFDKELQLGEIFVPLATTIGAKRDILNPEFVEKFFAIYVDTEQPDDKRAERLSVILSSLHFAEIASQEQVSILTGEMMGALEKLTARRLELSKIAGTIENYRTQIGISERKAEIAIEEIKEINSRLSDVGHRNEENRAIISSFKNTLSGFPYSLIEIPTIILILLVTMAAGGLGSVVAFTRQFLAGTVEVRPSRLFMNVGEGVAAEIAIFLFAGAGMLMLAQGGQGTDGAVELSPYMVAFIAFVSGFMAEDAFGRIQHAGRKMFHIDDGAG